MGVVDGVRAGPVAVTVTPIGTPNFGPADFHQFSAHFGADFSAFNAVTEALLPPPNHLPNPALGIGPGAPHAGPYTHELADGVADNGFVDKMLFSPQEWAPPNGIMFTFMVVPTPGTTGRSPDFASGPIIPNSQFPIHVSWAILLNGTNPFGGTAEFDVPPLDASIGFPGVDGHSHFPIFLGANSDPLDPRGHWTSQVTVTDVNGNGFVLTSNFDVVPEPASLLLWGGGLAGLLRFVRRRRNRAAKGTP
jgi:hypothetical protein